MFHWSCSATPQPSTKSHTRPFGKNCGIRRLGDSSRQTLALQDGRPGLARLVALNKASLWPNQGREAEATIPFPPVLVWVGQEAFFVGVISLLSLSLSRCFSFLISLSASLPLGFCSPHDLPLLPRHRHPPPPPPSVCPLPS